MNFHAYLASWTVRQRFCRRGSCRADAGRLRIEGPVVSRCRGCGRAMVFQSGRWF